MTKVEVIVRGEDAADARELLAAAGAAGYTSIGHVSGLGHHGFHQGRLLFNDQAALDLLITVLPDESAEALIVGLRELLAQRAGVMFVSDVYVSRPEYFS